MIDAFKKQEIDVGIGLTEAWVVGLTKNADKPYHMVGAYTLSPLLWAISTGGMREDISVVEELQGLKAGISRFGRLVHPSSLNTYCGDDQLTELSGSHIMASVLAQKYGWINDNSPPFDFVECGPFAPLRDAVGLGQADFFMWEHFTSKRYYYDKSLKKLGDIETPWNAWHIAARGGTADPRVAEHLLPALEKGIEHFKANKEESANFIASTMAYSQEDAQEWYEGVKFASRQELGKLDQEMIEKTLAILDQAGVLGQSKISSWMELAATKPDVYA